MLQSKMSSDDDNNDNKGDDDGDKDDNDVNVGNGMCFVDVIVGRNQ